MKRRTTAAATAFGAALLLSLTACASGGSVADSSPSSSRAPMVTPSAFPSPSVQPPQGEPAEVPPAKWDAIVAYLKKLGVTAEPELVSAESVTWNDGSLGCAKPGQSYTMAVVEGMKVVVVAAGTTYDLRFGRTDVPVLCQS